MSYQKTSSKSDGAPQVQAFVISVSVDSRRLNSDDGQTLTRIFNLPKHGASGLLQEACMRGVAKYVFNSASKGEGLFERMKNEFLDHVKRTGSKPNFTIHGWPQPETTPLNPFVMG